MTPEQARALAQVPAVQDALRPVVTWLAEHRAELRGLSLHLAAEARRADARHVHALYRSRRGRRW